MPCRVRDQSHLVRKFVATNGAGEGFLPGVRSHVRRHLRLLSAFFAAHWANEALVARVRPRV